MTRSLSDRVLRWLTFGGSVGGLAALAWALALVVLVSLRAPPITLPLVAAALLLAGRPLLTRVERWATVATHGTATSVMIAGFAPIFAGAAYVILDAPLITSLPRPDYLAIVVVYGAVPALLLFGILFGVLGALLGGRLDRLRDRALTFAAISAVGVGGGLATWATLRLVTHPSVEAYLGAAREALVVPRAEEPVAPLSMTGLGPLEGSASAPTGPLHTDDVSLDEQTSLRRRCRGDDCAIDLHPSVEAPGEPLLDHVAPYFPAHARLRVASLPAERLWLVQAGERKAAFRARTLERVNVSPLDLAGSIAPALPLVLASLLGVALAWIALARRESLVEQLLALDGAREAQIDEGGWLAFADGAPPTRAVAPLPPPGPVLVLSPRTAGASTYRSAIGLEERAPLLPGTRAEARAEVDAAIAGRFAAALAPIAVLTAPLAVFAAAALL